MRKMLSGIVTVVLVAMLMFSVDLPRDGPVYNDVGAEQSYIVDAVHNIGMAVSANEQLAVEHFVAVSSVLLVETRSEPAVLRNQRDGGYAYTGIAPALEFRFTHRTDNGWRILRT